MAQEVYLAYDGMPLQTIGQQDPDLYEDVGNYNRAHPVSSRKDEDPELMKQRLAEKIAAAATNRQREIEKLCAKLARQEEHARRVQERKKALGGGSTEELRLSVGGENGLAMGSVGTLDKSESSLSNNESTYESRDSSNFQSTSRGGSGRSILTDTTDVSDSARETISSNPLKQPVVLNAAARAAISN